MSTERMEDNEIDIESQFDTSLRPFTPQIDGFYSKQGGAPVRYEGGKPVPAAVAALRDLVSHHGDFERALQHMLSDQTAGEADEAYWRRQIRTLDHMKAQAEAALRDPTALVQPASWSIERGEVRDTGNGDGPQQEVLVQAPHGGGMWVQNKGSLAQRLLYALAMALTEPQTPLQQGDMAELFLELRANTGYSQRSRYTEITPRQWGRLVGVLEGTDSTWRGDDIERQAFEDAAFNFYLRKREERAAKGQGIALDDPNTVAEREMMFRRHPNGDYIAHAYQQAWGGWRMARGGV